MRPPSNPILLAVTAIAAIAATAPPALAQTEPLIHNQTPRLILQQENHAAADGNCPAVTPTPATNPAPLVTAGGCRVHKSATNVVHTVHLSSGGVEAVASICSIEYDIRIDAAGEGYITHQEMTPGPTGQCVWKACGQVTPPTSEGRAWSIYIRETETEFGPREEGIVLFCLERQDGTAGPGHCELTIPMSQPTLHRSRGTANDVSSHGVIFPHCEISAVFETEAVLGTSGEGQAEQSVEMRHT